MPYSDPAFGEEILYREVIKTSVETLANGTALLGMSGAIADKLHDPSCDDRQSGAMTWTELADMHQATTKNIADFGK
jgi:hypothetical protein